MRVTHGKTSDPALRERFCSFTVSTRCIDTMNGYGFNLLNRNYAAQHYQPTSVPPTLVWHGNVTSSCYHEARMKAFIDKLREPPMNMSVVDLLCEMLTSNSSFPAHKSAFMRSNTQMGFLLNLIAQDELGRKTLKTWLRNTGFAADLICEDIDNEMEETKADMRGGTRTITEDSVRNFDFEGEVTGVLKAKAPTLARVLYTAAQGARAAAINTYKKPDFVCVSTTSSYQSSVLNVIIIALQHCIRSTL